MLLRCILLPLLLVVLLMVVVVLLLLGTQRQMGRLRDNLELLGATQRGPACCTLGPHLLGRRSSVSSPLLRREGSQQEAWRNRGSGEKRRE